jgi:ComF family protein
VFAIDAVLRLLAPPFCWSCGGPSRPSDPLCLACRADLRWLDAESVELAGVEVWAPVAYDGPARALVGGLKFRGAAGLAATMAAQIAANAPSGLLDPPVALVPVPLHPRRGRARGFNQAELIATALGRRVGLPVADCLRRRGVQTRQVGRGRAERLGGIGATIELAPGRRAPERALIVDDVATTGASLAACAAALRAGGAHACAAVVYGLTPGR